jgi:hypothetical protein
MTTQTEQQFLNVLDKKLRWCRSNVPYGPVLSVLVACLTTHGALSQHPVFNVVPTDNITVTNYAPFTYTMQLGDENGPYSNIPSKHVGYTGTATFPCHMDASTFRNTYVYTSYDMYCFQADASYMIIKMEKKAWIDELLGQLKIVDCGPDAIDYSGCVLDGIRRVRDQLGSSSALDQLEKYILLERSATTAELKQCYHMAAKYTELCLQNERAHKASDIVRFVEAYVAQARSKTPISTYVATYKWLRNHIDIGTGGTFYEMEGLEGDKTFINQGLDHPLLLQYHRYLNKTMNRWPRSYVGVGYARSARFYYNEPSPALDSLAFQYQHMNASAGVILSGNYDANFFMSFYVDAGYQLNFRTDRAVERDLSTGEVRVRDGTVSSHWESGGPTFRVGLITGLKGFALRLAFNRMFAGQVFQSSLNTWTNGNTFLEASLSIPVFPKVMYIYRD